MTSKIRPISVGQNPLIAGPALHPQRHLSLPRHLTCARLCPQGLADINEVVLSGASPCHCLPVVAVLGQGREVEGIAILVSAGGRTGSGLLERGCTLLAKATAGRAVQMTTPAGKARGCYNG